MFDTADAAGDAALPRHLSSFHLEALRLGAASDAERARMESHLAGCGRCQEALAAWRASLQEFEAGALGRTRASVGTRGVRAASASRRRWISGGVGVLAAAAAVLVIWRGPAHPRNSGIAAVEPAVGIKGGLDLVVAVRRGDRVFHPDAEPVRVGDQVRFALDGLEASAGYLLIGSIDSSGRASIYVPYEGSESVPIPAGALDGRRFEIEGSIVLDATPGPERIFALLSPRPLPAGPVREALAMIAAAGNPSIRGTEALALPPAVVAAAGGIVQRTALLEKGAPQ